MASLLALMNRATVYFKEPKSVTGETGATSATSGTCGTNSEVSTDDESNCGSSVDGRSNKATSSTVNDEYKWEYCMDCDRFLKPRYYMNEEQMCQCCHEISLDEDKRCDSCGEVKHITLFRKPKLLYCEQCASDLVRLRKYCYSCECSILYGNWYNHLQTKKHRLRTYVELPADDYQGEYDKCIACHSPFQQSDLLNEHICVNCLINLNIPKKHCDMCNCDIMVTNWSRHLKTKKHLSNVAR
jgi:hypothetical protein